MTLGPATRRSGRILSFIVAIAVTVAGLRPATSNAAPQLAQPRHSAYGEAIVAARELAAVKAAEVVGLSVAIGIGGELVWAEGFGWADLEQRVPVSTTTRFRVGSTAKPLTAALLGQIYEEGAVDLDAPVQQYVPDFPDKEYPVTTRLLAGHLAGIRHYRGNEFLSSTFYPTVSEGLTIFAADPLLFEPGTRYSYSSYGWNLISAVIEGATGEDFLAQMQSRVFEPLGMLHTTSDMNMLIVRDRARPYVRDPDGRFGVAGMIYNAPYVDNSYKWAGGGFLSTASDMVRFGLAHLRPGLLKAETLQEWFASQRTSDGELTNYGIGWGSGVDAEGNRWVGHGGGSVGGTTQLVMYPDDGVVIVVISNLSGARGLRALVEDIAREFRAQPSVN